MASTGAWLGLSAADLQVPVCEPDRPMFCSERSESGGGEELG